MPKKFTTFVRRYKLNFPREFVSPKIPSFKIIPRNVENILNDPHIFILKTMLKSSEWS